MTAGYSGLIVAANPGAIPSIVLRFRPLVKKVKNQKYWPIISKTPLVWQWIATKN